MGPSTAPPCTAHVSWQGLLLTASLLTFWNVPTTAQLTIEAVPPNAAEGQDVLLCAHNLGADLEGYLWFRGDRVNADHQIARYLIFSSTNVPGPAHSGRETIFHNGSLLIRSLTQNDTGVYTLQTITADLGGTTASLEILVHPIQLTIEAVPPKAAEGQDILLCTHNLGADFQAYLWFKGNRVNGIHLIARYIISSSTTVLGPAHSGRETIFHNGSLLIRNLTQNDAGVYTLLILTAELSSTTASVEIHVYATGRPLGHPVGTVMGIVTGVLVGVVLIAALGCLLFLKRTCRSSAQHDLRERPSLGGGQLNRSVTKAPSPGPRTAVPVYEELLKPDGNIYDRINHAANVAY